MGVVADTVARVRQPEYTGENRCIPCTGANLVIAVGLAAIVGWLWLPAGLGLFVGSLGAIWARGYLIPRTPELTKRYFPEWLLAAFDKRETRPPDEGAELDVERELLRAGALRERSLDDDLELVPAFADAWDAEIERVTTSDTGRKRLAELLGLDPDEIDIREHGTAFVALRSGVQIGRWESRAAFTADVAAATLLADRVPGWTEKTPVQRSQLLNGLRLFVEACPSCGGPVRFGQEVVESCCREMDVIAVTCEDCESRLFEMDAPDELAAAG